MTRYFCPIASPPAPAAGRECRGPAGGAGGWRRTAPQPTQPPVRRANGLPSALGRSLPRPAGDSPLGVLAPRPVPLQLSVPLLGTGLGGRPSTLPDAQDGPFPHGVPPNFRLPTRSPTELPPPDDPGSATSAKYLESRRRALTTWRGSTQGGRTKALRVGRRLAAAVGFRSRSVPRSSRTGRPSGCCGRSPPATSPGEPRAARAAGIAPAFGRP